MKTIIVLYTERSCDYYVGVVDGILTNDQKAKIAEQYDAIIECTEVWDDIDDDSRVISFRETEVLIVNDDGIDLNGKQTTLINIWPQE